MVRKAQKTSNGECGEEQALLDIKKFCTIGITKKACDTDQTNSTEGPETDLNR